MSSRKVHSFLNTLEDHCKREANPTIAEGQKAYMRHQFDFYGIKTPVRRGIQKILFQKDLLPPKEDLFAIIKSLWDLPQRENQYIGQELAKRYLKNLEPDDHLIFGFMITHKSWWDTVDFIASNLVGAYFKDFPEKRDEITDNWMSSGNMWLQRSVLLFQLKYKETLDTAFLEKTVQKLLGSDEFFINKAIGWILREYSKTNPEWVINFVKETPLHSLSRKEALRLIK